MKKNPAWDSEFKPESLNIANRSELIQAKAKAGVKSEVEAMFSGISHGEKLGDDRLVQEYTQRIHARLEESKKEFDEYLSVGKYEEARKIQEQIEEIKSRLPQEKREKIYITSQEFKKLIDGFFELKEVITRNNKSDVVLDPEKKESLKEQLNRGVPDIGFKLQKYDRVYAQWHSEAIKNLKDIWIISERDKDGKIKRIDNCGMLLDQFLALNQLG